MASCKPDDLYWCEGMADWAPVANYRAGSNAKRLAATPALPKVEWGTRKTITVIGCVAIAVLVFAIMGQQSSNQPARPDSVLLELSAQAQENMRLVKEHKVRIGMIAEQAEMAWGKPDHVNRLTNAQGEIEQWVYPNGDRLYFTGGILRSMETTRRE